MRNILLTALCSALFFASPGAKAETAAPTYDRATIRQFMQEKLVNMQKVNEGMAREDYALVLDGLAQLDKLAKDATWRMIRTPGYQRRSRAFQDAVADLQDHAKAKDANASALAYLRLASSCFECHAVVRQGVNP